MLAIRTELFQFSPAFETKFDFCWILMVTIRVRPKLMTVVTTMVGLTPILWGTGAGSQTMKRIAAPMVGGLVSSTVLTLIVIPAIYYLWKSREVEELATSIDVEKETVQN